MTLLAHVAGLPIEETLLPLAPLAALGIGALVRATLARLRPRRRRSTRP